MSLLDNDVIVYGGGPGALRASLALADRGLKVALVGPVDAARWPTLAVGGIETGLSDEGERCDEAFVDTILAGDYLAARAPVRSMLQAAPRIFRELLALGVPFARRDGGLARRRLDGMRGARAAFVEARTTQAVTQTLDDMVTGCGVVRWPHHAIEALVADARDRFAGCIVTDRFTGRPLALQARALLLALGGQELTFAASPTAVATESALAVAFDAGAALAGMELVQTTPTAVWLGPRIPTSPRGRRVHVASSSFVGEGAVVWLPREPEDSRLGREVPRAERRDVLAEAFPGHGLATPADLASRVVRHEVLGQGLYDRRRDKRQPLAYLDVSHLPPGHLEARLGSELALLGKLSGADPLRGPLPIHPTLTDRLGGLWVDFEATDDGLLVPDSPRNHASTLEGVYACAGAAHAYHGANRASGNLLLADLFGAETAAAAIGSYLEGHELVGGALDLQRTCTAVEVGHEEVRRRTGGDSPIALHARLRESLLARAGMERDAAGLEGLVRDLDELAESVAKAAPRDASRVANQGAMLVRELEHAVTLALVTTKSALARRECRGVHHRKDHDPREVADGAHPGRALAPHLTLARRDDRGVRLETRIAYTFDGETRHAEATLVGTDVDERTHPRCYGEPP